MCRSEDLGGQHRRDWPPKGAGDVAQRPKPYSTYEATRAAVQGEMNSLRGGVPPFGAVTI
ncbi:hypothetical protein DJ531_12455 [Sulfolobus sp. A20-N-F6]|nr:hypothetical protein DJ531_12455 [Sulfolobus sp. A20-N-F6]